MTSTLTEKRTTRSRISEKDLERFEFHRHALALMPDAADEDPGVAVMIDGEDPAMDLLNCNCALSGKMTCSHIQKLEAIYRFKKSKLGNSTLERDFRESIWHQIATSIADGTGDTPQSVEPRPGSENGRDVLKIYGSLENELLNYISNGPDRARLVDRCILTREDTDVPSRAKILSELTLWTLSENERKMSERGFKSRRQALEEKFYYRLAYHAYRELGTYNFTINTDIDEVQGTFLLKAQNFKGEPVFHLSVPRSKVKALLECLKNYTPQYQGLEIHPVPLITVFKLSKTEKRKMALEITPCIQLTLQNGKIHLWDERQQLS